ncbi:nucleotidyltransferase [Acidaminobacter sp. JC074]|uniref:sugar phosphate nucleotidyltransferase n=1 Tax=Acidaminobacter sp. JC074 TaxID=2530199 RepID=UPI001F1023D3|nr:sugar phosphate nucleotidyltransferase [Acidaminobacter sp. JC074]MCH4888404.1 nucleotidyltransferase [Acidaminobacter sp. JC074]
MKPCLVVMAAGIGSRYGGLKQMDPVGPCGEWIIEYSIYDAIQAGFEKVIFIISQSIEDDFKDIVGRKLKGKIDIEYVVQALDDVPVDIPEGRVKPWGTAHAIYAARNLIKGPFAVINADDFYGRDAYVKVFNHLSDHDNFSLIGYELKNTLTENGSVARGVCQVEKGKLMTIVERTRIEKASKGTVYVEENVTYDIDDSSIVSMNLWGFTERLLDEINLGLKDFLVKNMSMNPLKCEYFLPYVVDAMIKENKIQVDVIKTDEKWFGVTYAADKPFVQGSIESLVEKGVYPRNLWEG